MISKRGQRRPGGVLRGPRRDMRMKGKQEISEEGQLNVGRGGGQAAEVTGGKTL